MASLLRKTAAGQAEVASKAHALPPRARSLLIMVDGKRSLEELRAMLGSQVDEALQLLLREGLVETLAASPVPAATAPAPLQAAGPSLEQIRRDAAHAITDALGPMGDALALRIERTRSSEELQQALRLALDALRDGAPRARAEAFRQRFLSDAG